MKRTQRVMSVVLSAMMLFATACTAKKTDDAATTAKTTTPAAETTAAGEVKQIQDKGTLLVGVTDFEPMDYMDASGKWIGFDAELAEGFAKSMGVEAKFVEIEWDYKVMELNGKSIDCVWNGMTLTDEVKSSMSTTDPYLKNAQVVIVNAEDADKYNTLESIKELNFAVESGSAGQKVAEANDLNFTEVTSQSNALMEVASGTSDAAIIDLLMASAMVGPDTGYEDLAFTVRLNEEEYGVGFRKDSDLTAKLNEYFKTAYSDGTINELAKKYKLEEVLISR